MRKRICVVGMSILGLLASGCHMSTDEQVLMRLRPNQPPVTRRLPYDGRYRLYAGAGRDPTTQKAVPLLERAMRKGERIGFAADPRGSLLVVVRDQRTALPAAG